MLSEETALKNTNSRIQILCVNILLLALFPESVPKKSLLLSHMQCFKEKHAELLSFLSSLQVLIQSQLMRDRSSTTTNNTNAVAQRTNKLGELDQFVYNGFYINVALVSQQPLLRECCMALHGHCFRFPGTARYKLNVQFYPSYQLL